MQAKEESSVLSRRPESGLWMGIDQPWRHCWLRTVLFSWTHKVNRWIEEIRNGPWGVILRVVIVVNWVPERDLGRVISLNARQAKVPLDTLARVI